MSALMAAQSSLHRARMTAVATAAALTLTPAQHATADDEQPTPPRHIDTRDPDLRMVDSATLAAPKVLGIVRKVLDIKSVVESDGGAERKEETHERISIALQADVLFGRDSSELSHKAGARIADLARSIKAQGITQVNVAGFTDNLGSYQHGVVLSTKRARTVQRSLARHLGSGISYTVRGHSEDHPIADNSTEAGRKKNRRVEISFRKTRDVT
jgi:outer membrane protein OmpA-like peptidoglycan-associated protein